MNSFWEEVARVGKKKHLRFATVQELHYHWMDKL